MKVSIVGLGYVGLPLMCAIAKKTDNIVVGYDVSNEKINLIKAGKCPVDDKQCEEDMRQVKLNVSAEKEILDGTDIFIICVPTPVLDDYKPDLEPVKNAAKEIAGFLHKGNYVIIESTINPGVCDEVVIPILEERTGLKAGADFDLAHCPERINPGDPKWSVYNIPRNIGSTGPEATKFLADFYRSFVDAEINEMPDLKTTEATKIIENTFRDINIAYVNELAKSFDVLGIDLMTVIKGASNKPFAFMPHYPGCGVGGHCIPVDPYYLIERAKQSGFDHKFLKIARDINNSMPEYTVDLLAQGLKKYEKSLTKAKIGLLGMSYKANVGDLRQSPSIEIKKILLERKADLNIYDRYFPDLSTCENLEEIFEKSFAIIIATDHREFKNITPALLKKYDVNVVIDGKNCLDKEAFIDSGIYYKGIGR